MRDSNYDNDYQKQSLIIIIIIIIIIIDSKI